MRRPICDDDLHAWADGRLDAARRLEVDAWLDAEPTQRQRVLAWRADAARLHAAFDPILDEPVPARLRAAVATPSRAKHRLRAAAALAWLALGVAGGTGLGYSIATRVHEQTPVALLPTLPRQAALAHAVYTPEVRHPVEVGAEQDQHLIAWLSKRLGMPVRIPDLATHGFRLLGGRLLPGESGPGAQFMYEDDGGRRLTLFLSDCDESDGTTAFRYAQEGTVGVFYWVDGRFGYALSAQLPREQMLPLATAVHHQITP